MNIDNPKSYATEANLMTAIEKAGFAAWRFLVVCNRKGRFTAIFPVSFNSKRDDSPVAPAHSGFMVIG